MQKEVLDKMIKKVWAIEPFQLFRELVEMIFGREEPLLLRICLTMSFFLNQELHWLPIFTKKKLERF